MTVCTLNAADTMLSDLVDSGASFHGTSSGDVLAASFFCRPHFQPCVSICVAHTACVCSASRFTTPSRWLGGRMLLASTGCGSKRSACSVRELPTAVRYTFSMSFIWCISSPQFFSSSGGVLQRGRASSAMRAAASLSLSSSPPSSSISRTDVPMLERALAAFLVSLLTSSALLASFLPPPWLARMAAAARRVFSNSGKSCSSAARLVRDRPSSSQLVLARTLVSHRVPSSTCTSPKNEPASSSRKVRPWLSTKAMMPSLMKYISCAASPVISTYSPSSTSVGSSISTTTAWKPWLPNDSTGTSSRISLCSKNVSSRRSEGDRSSMMVRSSMKAACRSTYS
mmetsp:Transcript_3477/g.12661  ORF Transcript_3477/g.12661 Transcript_3477/m.12661 type:complete len:341 (+) Transcript_3477:1170-2192(+)